MANSKQFFQALISFLYITLVATYSVGDRRENMADFVQLKCRLVDNTELCNTATNSTEFELQCYVQHYETWCFTGSGQEFHRASSSLTSVIVEGNTMSISNSSEITTPHISTENLDCHFHAGVEHCVNHNDTRFCETVQRQRNIPLRIGTLFTVFITSGIAILLPISLVQWTRKNVKGLGFILLKQFGIGVIISTALIHLYTHAQLMFSSDCLPNLHYEAVASAIVMAGLMVSFGLEYWSSKYLARELKNSNAIPRVPFAHKQIVQRGDAGCPEAATDCFQLEISAPVGLVSVLVMEAGVIFHSIIIGVTTVLAGDTNFTKLFVVVVFHQVFEGLALSIRIAESSMTSIKKILSASAYMLITPIGMAIGLGVLRRFNGNDSSTLIAIGTLNAFSAGILLSVGLVELLAWSWLAGELKAASTAKSIYASIALISGVLAMSALGKWI